MTLAGHPVQFAIAAQECRVYEHCTASAASSKAKKYPVVRHYSVRSQPVDVEPYLPRERGRCGLRGLPWRERYRLTPTPPPDKRQMVMER